MATEYDNTDRGVLFKNDRKKPGTKQPDYQGSINVGGTEYELAGWVNESKKTGKKFLSLKVSTEQPENTEPVEHDDDIPF